jgi:hypothetical protein
VLACAAALYRMPPFLVQGGAPATRIRELPVRHKYRRPLGDQSAIRQLDPFALPGAKPPTSPFKWQQLPEETRQTVTELMVAPPRQPLTPRSPAQLDEEGAVMSDKIKPHHLTRKAILYVRQSSIHEVLHSREEPGAAVRHAGLARRARLVRGQHDRRRSRAIGRGWRDARRVRTDGGRGLPRKSRRGSGPRISRFARNSRDWQQLIEMCRVVDTVLIDQEMVYAPRQGNARLLLGLKWSLNEYELDLLRQRSLSPLRKGAPG